MKQVMSTKQLADYLQLNEVTVYKWLEIESGWDQEFEVLLKRTQVFGRGRGFTEQKIQKEIEEVRRK